MHASRVVVVSLRKSGTHLVREAISSLGYALRGEIFATAEDQPLLAPECVWRILQMIYYPEELERLTASDDQDVIDREIKRAIAALNESWRIRFGIPRRGLSAYEDVGPELVSRALNRAEARAFCDTPENTSWFMHQLPLASVDEVFLREWAQIGEPRIILNYRDPRDTLLSMVNFLSGSTTGGVGEFAEHHIYGQILKSVPKIQKRLTIALTDPLFPGVSEFEDALWLLRHPNVCKVSFEDLVGPAGGGSEESQRRAVRRIIEFVDSDADPDAISGALFNPRSFTFHKGQIGGWREHFSPEHEAIFNERYGKLLELYSYA
jgi:hypothetical protein